MSGSIPLLLRAAAFAADRHRRQKRKDHEATPYINHPLEVARLLAEEGGVRDAEVLAAALLHDVIEDTRTSRAELARRGARQDRGQDLQPAGHPRAAAEGLERGPAPRVLRACAGGGGGAARQAASGAGGLPQGGGAVKPRCDGCPAGIDWR